MSGRTLLALSTLAVGQTACGGGPGATGSRVASVSSLTVPQAQAICYRHPFMRNVTRYVRGYYVVLRHDLTAAGPSLYGALLPNPDGSLAVERTGQVPPTDLTVATSLLRHTAIRSHSWVEIDGLFSCQGRRVSLFGVRGYRYIR
jgi:hypothetical protein